MFCPSCGKKIPTGSQFCLHCGKPIEQPSITPITEWEYEDFIYEFDPPPGNGMWAKLGKDGFSEDGARLEFWQKCRSQILSELQIWMDDGWQPVGEVGSSCVEIKISKSHRDKSPAYWLVWLIVSLPSFGLLFLFALLAVSIIAEPTRFVVQMRRPKVEGSIQDSSDHFLRFFATTDKPLTLGILESGLKKANTDYAIVETHTHSPETGTLMFRADELGKLEINRQGEELFKEDIEGFQRDVRGLKHQSQKIVMETLNNTQMVVFLQIPFQARDDALKKAEPLWEWLFANTNGLLHVNNDGFYKGKEWILELE